MRQTLVRLDEALYQRIKLNARRQNRSVNSLITEVLDRGIPGSFPKLDPKDFVPGEHLRSLGRSLSGVSTDVESLDAKARYILSK